MGTRKLTQAVAREDRALAKQVGKATDALGALRYEWCINQQWSYMAYGRHVGVESSPIRRSVLRYAAANGLKVRRREGAMAVPTITRVGIGDDTTKLTVICSWGDRAIITAAASRAGKPISTFIREAAVEAAKRHGAVKRRKAA